MTADSALSTILGAILGAILSTVLPAALNRYRKRDHPDLTGEWFSSWETKNRGSNLWVDEKIDISKRLVGGYHIQNKENILGFYYHGFLNFKTNRIVAGMTSSLKKSACTSGSCTLYISAQGDYLWGYSFAPNDDGDSIIRKFVIARTRENLNNAKKKFT